MASARHPCRVSTQPRYAIALYRVSTVGQGLFRAWGLRHSRLASAPSSIRRAGP